MHADGRIRWQRTDPWETGFVDITGEQALVGQVDGRTSAAVQAWLAARTEAFRAGVEVVVIDPHAGYAAAVRTALPDAQVAVDHFHLIMLANKAVVVRMARENPRWGTSATSGRAAQHSATASAPRRSGGPLKRHRFPPALLRHTDTSWA